MRHPLLTTDEIQLFKNRLTIIVAALGVVLSIWVIRLWYLQFIRGTYYDEVARGNRIRVVPQPAPRGIVYDRTGQILAYNRPAFNIQLILEDTPNLDRSLANLSRVTEVPEQYFRDAVRDNRNGLKFKPIVLLKDIGRKVADLIDTYQEDLPGISVAVESKRLYPTAFLTSHVMGYVGVINEGQLSRLPLNQLYSGRIVGQAGIELMENDNLIGMDGGRQVEVDHVGRELRVLSKPINPVPGSDIYLSVDLRLQRYVRSLMSGKSGVIIVAKPRTGEILSMSSFPDYDPNLFVGGIQDATWTRLTQGEERPLINKAVQGLYPPGSTFKMVLAAAALDTKVIDDTTTLNCPGYYRVGRDIRYCWKRSGHGDLTVRQAIEQSCNVFFYQLGMMMGVDTIYDYAQEFGFNRPTGIEMESEKAGLIPNRAWKEKATGEIWYDGETPSVAIGQGFVSVTPIQLLDYVNVIANGGLWVRPTIIRRIVSPEGRELEGDEHLPRETRLLPIPLEVFDVIRQGMVMAVNDHGTAGRARSRLFTVAGKTGTSQVVGRKSIRKDSAQELDESLLAHSLFVGFAPAEDPQVSIVVLVEHGEAGGRVAAPMARQILEFYDKNISSLEGRSPELKTAGVSGTVQPSRSPAPKTAGGSGTVQSFRRRLSRAFSDPTPLAHNGPDGSPSAHAH
jgi:penicillin-binding protein 2